MYPPVAIGQARVLSADLSLGDTLRLPSGTCAIVPHHAMHSTSFNWDKPNEFLPGALGRVTAAARPTLLPVMMESQFAGP